MEEFIVAALYLLKVVINSISDNNLIANYVLTPTSVVTRLVRTPSDDVVFHSSNQWLSNSSDDYKYTVIPVVYALFSRLDIRTRTVGIR